MSCCFMLKRNANLFRRLFEAHGGGVKIWFINHTENDLDPVLSDSSEFVTTIKEEAWVG